MPRPCSGFAGATGTPSDLGLFAAGTYALTGSGVVTTPGYGYFNPDGSYTADGACGAAGTNAKIGALIGTFSAGPSAPSAWWARRAAGAADAPQRAQAAKAALNLSSG